MKKKYYLTVGIILVIAVAGFYGYRAYASNQSLTDDELQTATVERGSLTITLSSSGNSRSGQSATVTWQTSGKIDEITWQTGGLVEEDQVLAELDPNSLSTEMIEAKQDLIDAQQALDDLLNSKLQQALALQAVEEAQDTVNSLKQTAAEERSQAQLALSEAQEAYDDAVYNRNKMNYPHSTDELVIEKAETDYLLAKEAYKEAKKRYIKYEKRRLTNMERVNALNNLVTAEQNMDSKFAIYNWYILDYTENDIAQADAELAVAEADLATAQANWDKVKNGSSEAVIAVAEAELEDALRELDRVKDGPSEVDLAAAQAAVDVAQASVDHASLLAPFTGTITDIYISTGDLVNAGDQAFRIDELDSIYIDLTISEVDLESLAVGQQVNVEFDAIADKEYSGEVTEIGMIGSVSQGVVTYPVVVQVTDADEDIRPGMTAFVSIITDQVDDVLRVPNKAIHTSGTQKTISLLYEGQEITVPVTVGMVGSSMSEVSSDQLREGDTVLVSGSVSSSSATTNQTTDQGVGLMGNGFGGPADMGGGPPPGMP